jgi:hypothetical protein
MAAKGSTWRGWTVLMFGFLLALNAALCAFAIGMALKDRAWHILGEDTSPAVRLLMFLLGAGLAWGVGRMTVVPMIRGAVAVVEAVPAAWCLTVLVALLFASMAFAGVVHWALLLVLLVVMLFFSVPAFWRLLGGKVTGLVLFLALVAGFAALYFSGVE